MDEEEPFEQSNQIRESLENEVDKLNNYSTYNKNKKLKFVLTFLVLILILIGIIIIIIILILKNKKESHKLRNYGQINCIYNINNINNSSPIFNPNYIKKQKLSILIDNKTFEYSNCYLFNETGSHNITIVLNEKNIDMNNMFKDIYSLISVEMISENATINNIQSTFENCINLVSLKIEGFKIEGLNSLNKFLYNTKNLKVIDLAGLNTSKIEDFSFMFANSNIKQINDFNFSTFNAKNISVDFSTSPFALVNL